MSGFDPFRTFRLVDFDRRVKLEFHGSDISSDGGLLPYRELDHALGLTELDGEVLSETRPSLGGMAGPSRSQPAPIVVSRYVGPRAAADGGRR